MFISSIYSISSEKAAETAFGTGNNFFMHSALIFDAYLSVHYIYENVYWCLPQNLLVYWYGIFFPYVWTLLAEDGS